MEADALDNCSDKFRFAGFKVNVKEHTCGVRVLKRATVAVKPRCKHNAVCTGICSFDNFLEIIVKVETFFLEVVFFVAVL